MYYNPVIVHCQKRQNPRFPVMHHFFIAQALEQYLTDYHLPSVHLDAITTNHEALHAVKLAAPY